MRVDFAVHTACVPGRIRGAAGLTRLSGLMPLAGRTVARLARHTWLRASGEAGSGVARRMQHVRFNNTLAAIAVALCAGIGLAGPAAALDPSVAPTDPFASVDRGNALRQAREAYLSGHKDQAVEAYRYAADKGQLGARWALAQMYAHGDGVKRDEYQAYRYYQQILENGVESGSQDVSFLSSALVAVAKYLRVGIPDTPVAPNPKLAQEYLLDAATNFRNPDAQFELGRIFLDGEGVKANAKFARKWFNMAAENGHARAQATLGQLYFQSGKVVRGLAMLTAALERARPGDRDAIVDMQEEAFAIATEAQRRTAVELAQDMLKGQ